MVTTSYRHGFARSKGDNPAFPTLWNGLIGAWSMLMGHVGLTTIPDLSGYGHDGTIEGTMTDADWILTAGVPGAPQLQGHALDFDDVDDQISITGSNAFFNMGTSPPAHGVTMSCWFNITDDHASGGTLCGLGGALNNGSWFMQAITTGRVRLQIDMSTSDLALTSATSSYNQNEWNLLSIHWDGGILASGCTMWLNGTDITAGASTSDGGAQKDATQDFQICNGSQGDVQIAQVLVHNRKLSVYENKVLWAYPAGPFIKQLQIVSKAPAAVGGTTARLLLLNPPKLDGGMSL